MPVICFCASLVICPMSMVCCCQICMLPLQTLRTLMAWASLNLACLTLCSAASMSSSPTRILFQFDFILLQHLIDLTKCVCLQFQELSGKRRCHTCNIGHQGLVGVDKSCRIFVNCSNAFLLPFRRLQTILGIYTRQSNVKRKREITCKHSQPN